MTVSDPARPSTPSEQFVAFITMKSTNPMQGMYAQHGIVHRPFRNGIHTSPPSADHTKYATPRQTTASSAPFLSWPHGFSERSSR